MPNKSPVILQEILEHTANKKNSMNFKLSKSKEILFLIKILQMPKKKYKNLLFCDRDNACCV
jgi:hypothetical protein